MLPAATRRILIASSEVTLTSAQVERGREARDLKRDHGVCGGERR